MKQEYPQDLQEAIRFHGHVCPGLLIGYRAAKAARSRLQAGRSEDEELVAIVETDACGIDAIQSLLGCTLGKGNLIFRDYGKQVFTVMCRKRRRAVRIAMKSTAVQRTAEQEALLEKVRSGAGSQEDRKVYENLQREKVDALLTMDDAALFDIEEVDVEEPGSARIFRSVVCRTCGENVMEPRARVRNGQIVCIPCAESYTRGW